MTNELRQTGRTQRMLEAALELVGRTDRVCIIGSSEANCHNMKLRTMDMAKAQKKRVDHIGAYGFVVCAPTESGYTVIDFAWGDAPTHYRSTLHILADHSVRDQWLSERQGWWDWETKGEAK